MGRKSRTRLRWGVLVAALMAVCLALSGRAARRTPECREPEFNFWLYDQASANAIDDLASLVEDYERQQFDLLPILPPVPGDTVLFDAGGLILADFKRLPADFVAGLEPEVWNGILTYPVFVREDPVSHDRSLCSLSGRELAWAPAPPDYDAVGFIAERVPWVKLCDGPEAYRTWLLKAFDPSRIVCRYRLVDDVNLVRHVWRVSLLAQSEAELESMAMSSGMAPTNFGFTAISAVSNGCTLSIEYPSGWTNMIDLFACTNLLVQKWWLVCTTNLTGGVTTMELFDGSATNSPPAVTNSYYGRFYDLWTADHDTDGDGLSDGREVRLYATGVNNPDTDDDGVGDGVEVDDGTDPTDGDDPPSVSGTVTYLGGQTGLIWVVAVTQSTDWATNACAVLEAPGQYRITKLTPGSYWLRAYRDSNADRSNAVDEAWGQYPGGALSITCKVTGVGIALNDPDNDADGLGDWWEFEHFGGLSANGSGNPDGDSWTNYTEYISGLNPRHHETDTGDEDDDGYLNVYEALYGTRCDNPALYPAPTIIVTNEGPVTIQQAIDAASSYDIIGLQPGGYRGCGNRDLDFRGKTLLLTSIEGADKTFIDCQGAGRGVRFCSGEDRETVLRGVTIKNGYAANGGGIFCSNASPTIVLCMIEENEATLSGGGAHFIAGSPVVLQCAISLNIAGSEGGGLSALGSEVLLKNSYVMGNRATDSGGKGGGAYLGTRIYMVGAYEIGAEGSSVTIRGGRFEANQSAIGSAVFCDDLVYHGPPYTEWSPTVTTLDGCSIVRNVATEGASIEILYATNRLVNCDVHGNIGEYGAGIKVSFGYLTVQNSTISSNVNASGFGGAGIYATHAGFGQTRVVNTIVWGNSPDEHQLYADTAGCSVTFSCYRDNFPYGHNLSIDTASCVTTDPKLRFSDGHLQAGSPCENNGLTTGMPSQDIDGERRTPGVTPSMGCDEFIDTDSDDLPDWWEAAHFASPTAGSVTADDDADGLTNELEYAWGTDPHRADTDSDGVSDHQELAQGTSPTDSPVDTDGDGLSNDAETYHGTSNTWWDSDGDGMSDAWEAQYGRSATTSNSPSANADGDAWDDATEYAQGTDPDNWDTDGDYVADHLDADPLDYNNSSTADDSNTTLMTLTVGDSSGSHTERYAMRVGPFYLHMPHVDANRYMFSSTVRVPIGAVYDGWVQSIADEPEEDPDGDYDADVAGERVWVPAEYASVLGGHHEDTGFNSGYRAFRVHILASTNVAECGTSSPGEPDANTIDPINTINGNVSLNETDVHIPCPGIDLLFRRSYDSALGATNGPVGACWSHSYLWDLESRDATAYRGTVADWKVIRTGAGDSWWFQKLSDGAYAGPGDNGCDLEQEGTNYFLTVGGLLTYTFDLDGVLRAIEEPYGNKVTLSYTGSYPNHQLSSVAHSNGQSLQFSYTSGMLTGIATPTNTFTVNFIYSPEGDLTNATRTISSGAQVTSYRYGELHAMTQRVNAAGHVFSYAYKVEAGRAMGTGLSIDGAYYAHEVAYDSDNGRTSVTYDRGDTNQVYEYRYNTATFMIDEILGPNRDDLAVTFTRNGSGLPVEVRTRDGDEYLTVKRSYEPNGNIASEAVGHNAAPSNTWTYAWDPDDETLSSATDPDGHKTTFEYENGRVTLTRQNLSTNETLDTTFGYTASGLLAAVTNANGHWVRFGYDGYGFSTSAVPQLGPTVRYTHDRLGHLTSVALPGSAGARTTTFDPDELGRVRSIGWPDGLSESFAYDPLGNLTNHLDRAGRRTEYAWLPTRKLSAVVRHLPGGGAATNSFVYDQQFNTLTIKDALGREVESYVLDIQNRPVTISNVESQTMSVVYGVGDMVKSVTRFDGSVVSNIWNGDGLLSAVAYPDETVAFSYRRNGQILTASNAMAVVSNAYDGAGRLIAVHCTPSVLSAPSGVNYLLDGVGNATNVVISIDGVTALTNAYSFDAAERVSTIACVGGTFAFDYGHYNGLVGGVSNTTSGIRASYAFDALDRLTNIVWRNATNGVLRSFACQYNSAGMITNVARETANENVAYEYDSLDRLTSASASYLAATYSWDLVGNPVSRSENGTNTSYTLGAGNKLVTWTGGSYGFDNAGCVTNITRGGDTISLSWDSRYQLASVSTNGTVAEEYVYGPLGRRVTTVANGVTNHHIYNGAHVVADLDADGDLIRSFQTGPGVDNWLGMTVHIGATPIVYYYLTDHIGTVHAVADANGDIVESYRYDPHGNVLGVWDRTGTPLTQSEIGNRILWQGREYSWRTGLYYFRARWYDPIAGRWLSNDPIGISGGLNQYVFCANNPVNFTDPFGLDFIYIVDANAVDGQGHAAVITGPVNGQWRYDSFGKPKGSHRHGQYSFTSEQDALNFARQHGYTHFARWQTSSAQNAAAQARADQWHTGAGQNYTTRRQYEIDGDNCQAMVDDAADAANLEAYIRRAGVRHPNVTMRYTRHGADDYGLLR